MERQKEGEESRCPGNRVLKIKKFFEEIGKAMMRNTEILC